MDFQQQDVKQLQELAVHLTSALPCPVAAPPRYAKTLNGPVFLPPCPLHTHLEEYIAPWRGREIWLDLALDSTVVTLTPDGFRESVFLPDPIPDIGFEDSSLHCHYKIETENHSARFTLWRTKADLKMLTQEAYDLGIKLTVSLYQEWADAQKPACQKADRF